MTYASETTVPAERTRLEIERTLRRYQATAFMYGWDAGRAVIGFQIGGRQVRFILPLPDREADEIKRTPKERRLRSVADQERVFEQATRQRWRALLLIIKAKLEAVEAGVVTMEAEFFWQTILPSGRTVGEEAGPQVAEMYRTGKMLPMLPGLETRPALMEPAPPRRDRRETDPE